MRCVRCCLPTVHAGSYDVLVAAALASAPSLQQSSPALVHELCREAAADPLLLADPQLQRIASVASLLPSRPYTRILAARLRQWRATGSFPRPALGVPDLSEVVVGDEYYSYLTPLVCQANDLPRVVAVLETLGPW